MKKDECKARIDQIDTERKSLFGDWEYGASGKRTIRRVKPANHRAYDVLMVARENFEYIWGRR